jgi:hypothetical protein
VPVKRNLIQPGKFLFQFDAVDHPLRHEFPSSLFLTLRIP